MAHKIWETFVPIAANRNQQHRAVGLVLAAHITWVTSAPIAAAQNLRRRAVGLALAARKTLVTSVPTVESKREMYENRPIQMPKLWGRTDI